MRLTNANYYTKEANQEYLSVSQYKDFCGTLGKAGCEAKAVAKLNDNWKDKKSTAFLVGCYVDAHFEGTLDRFKAENSTLFKRDGSLKAEYIKAEEIISRIERSELFMKYMSGEKQVIMTAEMFGAKWKIKIDSLIREKAIVDLKVMKSIREMEYCKGYGRLNFMQLYGYDIQGAIYQEVVYRNTGKRLPFFIAASSKEEEPDIEIIHIPDEHLQDVLKDVETNTYKILELKNGKYEPIRCELCDYCRHTKILKKAIWWDELLE